LILSSSSFKNKKEEEEEEEQAAGGAYLKSHLNTAIALRNGCRNENELYLCIPKRRRIKYSSKCKHMYAPRKQQCR
jgi:hypothetical protein